MDSFKVEKLRASKSYKKNHFLYNHVLHFLVALTFSLFLSFSFCFSSISPSMEDFGLISLPSFWSSFFNPKILFVVVNVIIVVLVGESKILSTRSSSTGDIYNEYVERRRLRRARTLREKKRYRKEEEREKQEKVAYEKGVKLEEANRVEHKKLLVEKKEDQERAGEVKKEDEQEARLPRLTIEEKGELPAEELNRRVEEFIARINKQRWLEANSLVCYEP